jgi:PAS domain-containing protein
VNKLKAAIEEGREETVIIKNYRRDGSSFWNRTQICPMRDDAGKVSLIIGLQTEVRNATK